MRKWTERSRKDCLQPLRCYKKSEERGFKAMKNGPKSVERPKEQESSSRERGEIPVRREDKIALYVQQLALGKKKNKC